MIGMKVSNDIYFLLFSFNWVMFLNYSWLKKTNLHYFFITLGNEAIFKYHKPRPKTPAGYRSKD